MFLTNVCCAYQVSLELLQEQDSLETLVSLEILAPLGQQVRHACSSSFSVVFSRLS